jgi:YgiT-type zinc finger domain-containing protein
MTDQIACPRCQIGNLQPAQATYASVHKGMFLSVPNVPAWQCDICQFQEFDYDVITWVEALMGHAGMPADASRPAAKVPTVDADATADTGKKQPHRVNKP